MFIGPDGPRGAFQPPPGGDSVTREAQQAAADTAPMGFHYITGGAGNSCFLVLGVPNAREGKTKQQKKEPTLNSVPTFRSPPFSFLPHTQDHTLALAPPGVHVCLPTQRSYRSHRSSGYLSKENGLKETPRAQWHNLTPATEHGHTELRAGWRRNRSLLVGKVPSGFRRKKQLEARNCC